MRSKKQCETCELKGYSPELCKVHYQRSHERDEIPQTCPHRISVKEVGKSAMLGAGVGVAATVIGLAAVPAATIKTLCGHVVACKLGASAGGGVTGAGINAYRKTKKQRGGAKDKSKRRVHLPVIF